MIIKKLADEYGSEYRTPMFDAYPKALAIASIDEADSYEVDQTTILRDAHDGMFILATASGCSCWDGIWELTKYDSLTLLLEDIGAGGDSDRLYNPSFAGIVALRGQLEASEWINPKGDVDDQC
jgi:hypothetical protein